MWSLFQTLSFRYLSRRWLRTGLIALSIGLGVATLIATQALNYTMAYAAVFAANPTSGFADLIVSNGDLPVPVSLEAELAKVPGVIDVQPRIFENAFAVDLESRSILVLGLDAKKMLQQESGMKSQIDVSKETQDKVVQIYLKSMLTGRAPILVGRELHKALGAGKTVLKLRRGKASKPREYEIAGPLDAVGDAASMAGFVVFMDLGDARKLFELKNDQVHRFDIGVKPGTDPDVVRGKVEAMLQGRAAVHTFAEHSQTTQNVMAGMQTGFALCGLAALVVGLFLVYNALAVTVAERRHEIGILLSLGATRGQVLGLFAGEAFVLGLIGSLLGLPLGVALAQLGLKPMQGVLGDIFFAVDARELRVSWQLFAAAAGAGVTTTLLAALIPAYWGSRENPAEAVRKVNKATPVSRLFMQIGASVLFVVLGTACILFRGILPARFGTMGGMVLVLVGGLLSAPFFSALIARMIQPFVRTVLSIEWRLGADNIVRSPGRTGLVIGALAAGVSLVMQTAGVIKSNRLSIQDWIHESIGADLVVTSGSPVGAGGQTHPMPESLVAEMIRKLPEVENALPVRMRKVPFRGTQILIFTTDAGAAYPLEKSRLAKKDTLELYRRMDETPGGIIISDNLATLQRIRVGDKITLPSPKGEVVLTVVGAMPDYSWNHGSLFMHRRDLLANWNDHDVDVIDVYLRGGADPLAVKTKILAEWGGTHGLHALTRVNLINHINEMVEKVYGVAYAQQIVVMIVAGLGVITALLISVLQRKHEMGLLRAIGASRGQVIHSVLAEACLMGVIGTLIGVVVGIPMQWYVLNVVLLEEAGFAFPVYLPWVEAGQVAAAALITAILAGLGPAIYAVRQRIPDAIAYE